VTTLRWMVRNLSTLLLSFVLAVTVWAAAVVTSDPNEDRATQPVPLEITGLAPDLLLTNRVPTQAVLTIKAPRSIWDELNNDPSSVRAWIDLSGLAAGEHEVTVRTEVNLSPFRLLKVEPGEVQVVLDKLTSEVFPVEILVSGEPPLGYRKGQPQITPAEVTVSGPESAVKRVSKVTASLDISGASQSVSALVPVRAIDENNVPVTDVNLNPKDVTVLQPISILGGYKNVAVKVLSTGQLAEGYRLTNISVAPPTITVYSANPQLVNELPGFIETMPVDLSGLSDDTEFNTELNLPDGITLVSEPGVLVQIGVAAIEGSLTLTLPVEVLGLQPTLAATISPPSVDVIITGPLPILDNLTAASFRAVVDLTGLAEGKYQIEPSLDLIPEEVQIQAVLPETVEVTIAPAPTPTPTSAATRIPAAAPASPAVTLTPTKKP